ncbi:hypothetical protein Sjap_020143 [Stephania japonica]|uniref:Uncharacterized protein n=1 Tax=Stephania japonica TaxID=461633 RepID=A0AAP0F0V7_9MAGN
MEPPRVHGIPIRLIANDTELHPSHFCARRMKKVFKRWMIPEGYCWKSMPLIIKTNIGANGRLQRRCQELTQATPDQSVDDEVVYLNVAGECPKGRVYGLGSLGRKKRRYADPGASTSEMPDLVPRAEFNVVAEQLRKVMEFMQQHLGMNMDGTGLSQQQPPPPPPPPPPLPPPPHDQQQLSQIDPVDPPQQGDNVERRSKAINIANRLGLPKIVIDDALVLYGTLVQKLTRRWSGSVSGRYLALYVVQDYSKGTL